MAAVADLVRGVHVAVVVGVVVDETMRYEHGLGWQVARLESHASGEAESEEKDTFGT